MVRIAFRADASSAIGSGHVMRCATLARELATRGAKVHFLCQELPGDYCGWLQQQGFAVTRLQSAMIDGDIDQCRAALTDKGRIDWLVVDHYGLDERWESALRPLVGSILAIDDVADRTHDCDILLDQNFVDQTGKRYIGRVSANTECLLGPRYALLRPEFAATRRTQRVRDGLVKRLLICFGGSDSQQHTLATLHALRTFLPRIERVDVVIGHTNQNRASIATACAKLQCATLHSPAGDIAALLAQADLAIGAGGSMSWERACLGVPTLAFGIADNQYAILEAMLENGYLVGVARMTTPDPLLIEHWLGVLLSNPSLLRGLATRSATLVDGRGTIRVADRLLPSPLVFRPATVKDSENLLLWRNHPSIRMASLVSDEISAETHCSWLQRTLADPLRLLLIAECNGQALGVVRFDLAPPQATISVYRVQSVGYRRGRLIQQASNWLRQHHPEIRRIIAEVVPNNSESLAAFRAAGYHEVKNTLAIELD